MKMLSEKIDFEALIHETSDGGIFLGNRPNKNWVIKYKNLKSKEDLIHNLSHLTAHYNCSHPSVLPILDYQVEDPEDGSNNLQMFIKIPYMQRNLQEEIESMKNSKKLFSEETLVKYFYEIVCGLQFLHKKKFHHGNLRPETIFLNNDDMNGSTIRLAKINTINKYSLGDGTINFKISANARPMFYIPPEILHNGTSLPKDLLQKGDAWSLGVIMAELYLLEFIHHDYEKTRKQIFDEEAMKNQRGYKSVLTELISGLLESNSSRRLNLEEVLIKLEENYGDLLLNKNNQSSPSSGRHTDSLRENLLVWKKDVDKEFERRIEKGLEETINEIYKQMGALFEFRENNCFAIKSKDQLLPSKKEIEELAAETIQNILKKKQNHIKDLKFTLKKDKITNEKLSNFCFNHFSDLENLSLELKEFRNLTSETLRELSKSIKQSFPKVQNFILNLEGSLDVIQENKEDFSEKLTSALPKVKKLDLGLDDLEIPNEALEHFCSNISKNMTQIQHLSISLASSLNSKKKNLNCFAHFSKLENIQEISLALKDCDLIDKDLQDLKIIINHENFKNLRKIHFNLGENDDITEEKINELEDHLNNFIEDVEIKFDE